MTELAGIHDTQYRQRQYHRRVYPLDARLLTEEQIAVAFAMTSRVPDPFDVIAQRGSEEKAADFHERWVLGYGHASVAEHAVVHLAIENISRLACDGLEDNSDPCEPEIGLHIPLVGWNIGGRDVDHGVSVAELVDDMAPNAKLYYAQANSPRQVYRAAWWLNKKGVDVIVHASGWPYDGSGNGDSPLDVLSTHTSDARANNTDEHSADRYHPSPLSTVDAFVTSSSGPIWVNAAGNMEQLTMKIDDPDLLGGTGTFANYLVLNDGYTDATDPDGRLRTCQEVPKKGKSVYMYSLRWADSWPVATKNLDFFVATPGMNTESKYVNPFAKSSEKEQLDRRFAVRTVIKNSVDREDDHCLRIKVNANSSGQRVAPEWVQFQILTNLYDVQIGTSDDGQGHSIVNPASSANKGLLAVGALNYPDYASDSSSPELTAYSSAGPVFDTDENLISDDPTRTKPDVVAASEVATHTKWENCDKHTETKVCHKPDEMLFGGTSAATGHVGGIVALVVDWFKDVGVSYTPEDITEFVKNSTKQMTSSNVPNSSWGHGLVVLPCPPTLVESLPYTVEGEWDDEDCVSTRRAERYADYYTFKLDSKTKVQIDLESDDADTYLYLIEGIFSGGDEWETKNDDIVSGNTDSRIIETLEAGAYTVAVTTFSKKDTGDYDFNVKKYVTTPKVVASASLSPSPENVTFYNDSKWLRFIVSATVPIKVIANPTGSSKRVEITTSSSAGDHCPADYNDSKERSNGERVFLAGCTAGPAKVELRAQSDNALLATYNFTVAQKPATAPPPPATVCKPLQSFSVVRRGNTYARITWTNPSNSLTSTGKRVEVRKYTSGTNFAHERYITEPASATSSWHIGMDSGGFYNYRARNECSGNTVSAWSSWWLIGPYRGVSAASSGAAEDEVPKPTPGIPQPYEKDPADEQPPPPSN